MASTGVELPSTVHNTSARARWISRQEIWLASVPIVLAVHIWSILHLLEELPAWILRLSVGELVGAIAYSQAFALFESSLILTAFLVAGLVLPRRWFAEQFAPATGLLILAITPWAIAAHEYDRVIRNWGPREILPWLFLIGLSLLLALVLAARFERVRKILSVLIDRAAILAAVYLLIDAVSLIVILVRNL